MGAGTGPVMVRKRKIEMFMKAFLLAVGMLATSVAWAAGGVVESPTGVAPDRYVYYPGTEALDKDEIRLISCGTGLPAARRDQAATCWLAELGNGDKFLFDVGTGSMTNVAALMIPYDFLDKVFLTHLHTDHWGDLATLWAGGWTAGRTQPLRVWGPAGQTLDMGTAYAVEHFLKAYNWDAKTRNFVLSSKPGEITDEEIGLMLETLASHHFNFVLPNMDQGEYDIIAVFGTGAMAMVDIDQASVDDGGTVSASAFAKAFIGNYMVTVQQVRATKGGIIDLDIIEP